MTYNTQARARELAERIISGNRWLLSEFAVSRLRAEPRTLDGIAAALAAALDEAHSAAHIAGLRKAKSYAEHLGEAWDAISKHERTMRLDSDVGSETARQIVSVIAIEISELTAPPSERDGLK